MTEWAGGQRGRGWDITIYGICTQILFCSQYIYIYIYLNIYLFKYLFIYTIDNIYGISKRECANVIYVLNKFINDLRAKEKKCC